MWDFFEYIVVNTVEGSKEIEGFKENMKEVGIENYKISSGKKVGNKNVNENENECDCLSKVLNQDKSCYGQDVYKEIIKANISEIKEAYKKGCNNIFLFEDDARFEKPLNFSKVKKIINWLKSNQYWEAFYFGYLLHPNPLYIPVNLQIGRVFRPILSHCMVIHRRGMEKILKDVQKNGLPVLSIDTYYSRFLDYKYATYPAINYQCKTPGVYLKGEKFFMEKFHVGKTDFTILNKVMNSFWIIIFVVLAIIIGLIIYLLLRQK